MRNTFRELLKTNGSCAQETLAAAMIEWWMAADKYDAMKKISNAPGCDLAGIANSVLAGLTQAATLLECDPEQLISESDIAVLQNLTAMQIVEVLNAIHLQWIEDNFTAKRWAEKYFKGQLGQYRKTSRIPFEELVKDLLFVQQYLTAAGCEVSVEEIHAAFDTYVTADTNDDDVFSLVSRAKKLAPEIISQMEALIGRAKPEIANQVEDFLAEHNDPEEIMDILVVSACG